jgi:uncharacterized protein YbjT (DUF2867 family)
MRIVVTGGTGYVGQPLVASFLHHGHDVVVLQRQNSRRPMNPVSDKLRVVTGDLFSQAALLDALQGADAVVHLVGIIRESRRAGITMQRIHVDGTAAVVAAAETSGVQRFLHMSALGARPGTASTYHQTKWEAEEIVRSSDIPHTIFQPSVIFGPGGPGPNFIQQLTDLVERSPVCPVIGDGNALLQPVSIRTVIDGFRKSLDTPVSIDQTYEMGGPEILSYFEILRRIAKSLEKRLVPIHVPLRMMELMASWFQSMRSFPITRDQITMLKEGNVCTDPEALYRDLPLTRVPFQVEAQQGHKR